MNVFVAGVHGVGKTYLCERVSASHGFSHASASKLIREQLALPEWNSNKLVSDIEGNQWALIAAIERYAVDKRSTLLDGHFLLRNESGKLTEIPTDVFSSLKLTGVVLLEKDIGAILRQIAFRDGHEPDAGLLQEAIGAERLRAQEVCSELALPLKILNGPNEEEFANVVANFFEAN